MPLNLILSVTMVSWAIYKTVMSQKFGVCGINRFIKYSSDNIGRSKCFSRHYSDSESSSTTYFNKIGNKNYTADSWTNVTPKILSYVNRNLHNQKYHPLELIKQRIVNYIYAYYPGRKAPQFSVYDKVSKIHTFASISL